MPKPRVISLAIFRHGPSILVAQGYDEFKAEYFFRPIGGEVEFGETAVEAIHREVKEELGVEIQNVRQLAVLENHFHYNSQPGHEIVFVHDAEFVDSSLYSKQEILIDEDVWVGPARWLSLDNAPASPLYPDGLMELLTDKSR